MRWWVHPLADGCEVWKRSPRQLEPEPEPEPQSQVSNWWSWDGWAVRAIPNIQMVRYSI